MLLVPHREGAPPRISSSRDISTQWKWSGVVRPVAG